MTHVNPRGHLKRSLHGLGLGRLDPERLGLGSDQRPLLVTLLTMGNVTNIMDSEGLGRLGHRGQRHGIQKGQQGGKGCRRPHTPEAMAEFIKLAIFIDIKHNRAAEER